MSSEGYKNTPKISYLELKLDLSLYTRTGDLQFDICTIIDIDA